MDELYTMERPRQMPVFPRLAELRQGRSRTLVRVVDFHHPIVLQQYTHGASSRLRHSSCNFGVISASN